jgi:hypothetical protein
MPGMEMVRIVRRRDERRPTRLQNCCLKAQQPTEEKQDPKKYDASTDG